MSPLPPRNVAAYMFGVALYLTVTVPALQAIVTPAGVEDVTQEDRIQAIRVLAAGNVIVAVCLGGILFLQAGQEYARRAEAKVLREAERSSAKQGENEKKDQ
ncbi:hypothetical protein H0H87_009117 [Tephrocybe sp. NHM501043]|nr:hypothetical protein H0H87_009117 [Tephrocybe sp. NHM501043]